MVAVEAAAAADVVTLSTCICIYLIESIEFKLGFEYLFGTDTVPHRQCVPYVFRVRTRLAWILTVNGTLVPGTSNKNTTQASGSSLEWRTALSFAFKFIKAVFSSCSSSHLRCLLNPTKADQNQSPFVLLLIDFTLVSFTHSLIIWGP